MERIYYRRFLISLGKKLHGGTVDRNDSHSQHAPCNARCAVGCSTCHAPCIARRVVAVRVTSVDCSAMHFFFQEKLKIYGSGFSTCKEAL